MVPDIRVGIGYDVHSFIEHTNDEHYITLCGIQIAHSQRLNGHSDSDVALHALTDALLGTYNLGDIGTHFPPTEKKWENAPSSIFIKKASELISLHNGIVSNIDITIIAETPRISSFREKMCEVISQMLNIEINRVSVKATTNECIGFIGRGEGIAAIASACVIYQ